MLIPIIVIDFIDQWCWESLTHNHFPVCAYITSCFSYLLYCETRYFNAYSSTSLVLFLYLLFHILVLVSVIHNRMSCRITKPISENNDSNNSLSHKTQSNMTECFTILKQKPIYVSGFESIYVEQKKMFQWKMIRKIFYERFLCW